jgi:hypothetical protein
MADGILVESRRVRHIQEARFDSPPITADGSMGLVSAALAALGPVSSLLTDEGRLCHFVSACRACPTVWIAWARAGADAKLDSDAGTGFDATTNALCTDSTHDDATDIDADH